MLLVLLLAALAPARRDPRLEAVVQRIEPAALHATVAKLVGFGTRHTLSDTKSETRGIGAARRWLGAQFAAAAQGTRLKTFEDRFTAEPGRRIPAAAELINVGAVLPGSDAARAKQAIVMTGHYDSIPSNVMDAQSDAPGAVDDASGTAMALELARAFAKEQPAVTVYFVAVAGEEQGLIGSAHLAQRLKQEGIEVLAMTSVDIAGNVEGQNGAIDNTRARLYSEGTPVAETEAQKRLREAVGGENDSPSREWARYLERLGERYVENLELLPMLRRDRIARGSDHMSFNQQGFPAVRLSEMVEHYDREHQTPRTENGRPYGDDLAHFDSPYAAKLCRALAAALGSPAWRSTAAAPTPSAGNAPSWSARSTTSSCRTSSRTTNSSRSPPWTPPATNPSPRPPPSWNGSCSRTLLASPRAFHAEGAEEREEGRKRIAPPLLPFPQRPLREMF